jgi:hypothetical protein
MGMSSYITNKRKNLFLKRFSIDYNIAVKTIKTDNPPAGPEAAIASPTAPYQKGPHGG